MGKWVGHVLFFIYVWHPIWASFGVVLCVSWRVVIDNNQALISNGTYYFILGLLVVQQQVRLSV